MDCSACAGPLVPPHDLSDLPGEALLLLGTAALAGRALWTMAGTYRAVDRARHRISASQRPATDGLTFAELGTVACTIGFLRPQILLDTERFGALNTPQQRAVIAHEHNHARTCTRSST